MGGIYASWGSFLVVSLALAGGAAYASGRAAAADWSPGWTLVPIALALAAVARFLHYALFEDRLLAIAPFLIDLALTYGFAWLGHRVARVAQMTGRYPFAFERAGRLSWRERRAGA